jgi:hypothetical protein
LLLWLTTGATDPPQPVLGFGNLSEIGLLRVAGLLQPRSVPAG